MNDATQPPVDDLANASREEILAAMFANMVIQQTNMAMMLLGKVAHPETGQFLHDVEAAKMFIDQLEMLEAKTKGNLSKQEEGLLKQALAALHMAFVEAINAPAAGELPEEPATAALASSPAPEPVAKPVASPAPVEASTAPDESRKKFSKKY